MRLTNDGEIVAGVVTFVACCALAIGFAWAGAAQEAAAYERVTGVKVSTWDALWLELRVDGSGK